MNGYQEAQQQDQKRRRRERYLIIFLFLVISSLVYFGMRTFDPGVQLPFSSSILVFVLININVILLLLLLYLTVRNLVKLLFERKRGILGAKLRTKLVLAFLTLSLLPTIILFFVSAQFISASIEYWFNVQIEQSLKTSLEVGQDFYDHVAEDILFFGNHVSRVITYEGLLLPARRTALKKYIEEKGKESRIASLTVFSGNLASIAHTQGPRMDPGIFEDPPPEVLHTCLEKGTDRRYVQSSDRGDLLSGIVPVFSRTQSKAVVGLVSASRWIPGKFVNRMKAVSKGLQEYRQLKMLKKPIKTSHMITLSIVTLLIIFSSVWFGFYLSKEITVPIGELAQATHRIASGDYDFFIDLESRDEVGSLVNAFNRMTMDLKVSKNKLEEAYDELIKSNIELEQRRQYMEFVLANVAAGVVSADAQGTILTINKSAESMLDIQARQIIGKNYREVLAEDHIRFIDRFLGDEALFRKGFLKRQIRLSIGDSRLTLLVSLNVLRDEQSRYLGLVAVLEDLSEIEKAQRMAAWREVARRIAHEVKNPLTPIQLSAQRLRKKYGERLGEEEGKVFQDCTEMIIRQVDELKRLVNEFSNFARMPAANPAPEDIREIIREALSLYTGAHKGIRLSFEEAADVPVFDLDREQIKRVIINLLDNAIEAAGEEGEITIRLIYDKVLQMVRIEISDTGRGISPENKARLFEPYFSTKKQGTGLGLTIVNTIITDHNGFVRVRDNPPRGTTFIIELPVRA